MPIRYAIDRASGLVLTTASGSVGAQDLLTHVRRLAADPELRSPIVELFVHEPGSTLNLSGIQVRQVIGLQSTLRGALGDATLAIVTPSDLMYGMARIAQTVAEATNFRIRVFREFEPARAYVDSILQQRASDAQRAQPLSEDAASDHLTGRADS